VVEGFVSHRLGVGVTCVWTLVQQNSALRAFACSLEGNLIFAGEDRKKEEIFNGFDLTHLIAYKKGVYGAGDWKWVK
jgi:hypothetical protein